MDTVSLVEKIRVLPDNRAAALIQDLNINEIDLEALLKVINIHFYSDPRKAEHLYGVILEKDDNETPSEFHKHIEKRFFKKFVSNNENVITINALMAKKIHAIAMRNGLGDDVEFWNMYLNKLDDDEVTYFDKYKMVFNHFKDYTSTTVPRLFLETIPGAYNGHFLNDRYRMYDWTAFSRMFEFYATEYPFEKLSTMFLANVLVPVAKLGDKKYSDRRRHKNAEWVWTESHQKFLEKVLDSDVPIALDIWDWNWNSFALETDEGMRQMLEPGISQIFDSRDQWETNIDERRHHQRGKPYELLEYLMLKKEQDRKEYLLITAQALYKQLSQVMPENVNVQVLLDMFLMTANNWKKVLRVYRKDDPYKTMFALFTKLSKRIEVTNVNDVIKTRANLNGGDMESIIKKVVSENNL